MSIFFFFNDTATTEIYPLSLHDALPISRHRSAVARRDGEVPLEAGGRRGDRVGAHSRGEAAHAVHFFASRVRAGDRKSIRLNASHLVISNAVFCLKKKKDIFICG